MPHGMRTRDIIHSVNAGLNLRSDLTPAIVPYVEWGPSVGIAAGRIDKLGADIRSFRVPLTESIKTVVIPSIRTNFDVGGRPEWDPLATDTQDKRGPGAKVLVRTGKLKAGASQLSNWRITSATAVMTNIPDRVWYGRVHQAGSGAGDTRTLTGGKWVQRGMQMMFESEAGVEHPGIGRGHGIPARPFVVLQEEDEVKIYEIFNLWLETRVLGSFG